jgi:hypothetical protein
LTFVQYIYHYFEMATTDENSTPVSHAGNSPIHQSSPDSEDNGVTNMDDMPSLDALSFSKEPCSSPNCHCSRHKNHREDAGDASGLSAFGGRTSSRLPMKRQLDDSRNRCSGHCRHTKIVSPPVFFPPVSSSPVVFGATRPLESRLRLVSTAASIVTATTSTLFGAVQQTSQPDVDFGSLARLHPSGIHVTTTTTTSLTTPVVTSFQGASFRNCHQRGGAVDLSELRSALLQDSMAGSSDLSPPTLSTCPAHRPLMTTGVPQPCTCSQQASRLDDWSVDELASYLDDFCYIPKKMSAMAEMMYM